MISLREGQERRKYIHLSIYILVRSLEEMCRRLDICLEPMGGRQGGPGVLLGRLRRESYERRICGLWRRQKGEEIGGHGRYPIWLCIKLRREDESFDSNEGRIQEEEEQEQQQRSSSNSNYFNSN